MDIYTVITSSTCISAYTVQATSKQEAKDKMYAGEWQRVNCIQVISIIVSIWTLKMRWLRKLCK